MTGPSAHINEEKETFGAHADTVTALVPIISGFRAVISTLLSGPETRDQLSAPNSPFAAAVKDLCSRATNDQSNELLIEAMLVDRACTADTMSSLLVTLPAHLMPIGVSAFAGLRKTLNVLAAESVVAAGQSGVNELFDVMRNRVSEVPLCELSRLSEICSEALRDLKEPQLLEERRPSHAELCDALLRFGKERGYPPSFEAITEAHIPALLSRFGQKTRAFIEHKVLAPQEGPKANCEELSRFTGIDMDRLDQAAATALTRFDTLLKWACERGRQVVTRTGELTLPSLPLKKAVALVTQPPVKWPGGQVRPLRELLSEPDYLRLCRIVESLPPQHRKPLRAAVMFDLEGPSQQSSGRAGQSWPHHARSSQRDLFSDAARMLILKAESMEHEGQGAPLSPSKAKSILGQKRSASLLLLSGVPLGESVAFAVLDEQLPTQAPCLDTLLGPVDPGYIARTLARVPPGLRPLAERVLISDGLQGVSIAELADIASRLGVSDPARAVALLRFLLPGAAIAARIEGRNNKPEWFDTLSLAVEVANNLGCTVRAPVVAIVSGALRQNIASLVSACEQPLERVTGDPSGHPFLANCSVTALAEIVPCLSPGLAASVTALVPKLEDVQKVLAPRDRGTGAVAAHAHSAIEQGELKVLRQVIDQLPEGFATTQPPG